MMNEFPFSVREWDAVTRATLAVTNATLMDDVPLRRSLFVSLQRLLSALAQKYGNHPILLETEADFSGNPAERKSLYYLALQTAIAQSLPTFTIRLSLAELLLVEFGEPELAKRELHNCDTEVQVLGDDFDRASWRVLLHRCNTVNLPAQTND